MILLKFSQKKKLLQLILNLQYKNSGSLGPVANHILMEEWYDGLIYPKKERPFDLGKVKRDCDI